MQDCVTIWSGLAACLNDKYYQCTSALGGKTFSERKGELLPPGINKEEMMF